MITIPTAEQEAFQSSAPKTLTLNFPFSDPITNEGIYMESAQLEQAICEESNLTFGMVYSSHFSVRIFDTGETYTGLRVNPVISVTVDGTTYSRSLGYYTVKSDRLTSDKLYRDLECYDYLADVLSADFTTWHNSMMVSRINTLKQYRDAFFTYIGLEQENVTLPNDNSSISPFMQLDVSGASVISAILQMSGAFGYIGYDGKFKYVLPTKTPTVTISDNSYIQGSLNYEDEPMKKISGVKILGWEDDYGEEGSTTIPDVTAGDSTYSMLTIEDNFLIHGCKTETRQTICNNLYNSLVNFDYYPSSVEVPVYIGLEPGDVFKIETDRKDIYFPVLKRTMKGISSLRDEIEAQGEYELTDSASTGVISGTQLTIEQMRESISELLAQKASIEAQDAAIQANIAANSALTQLSIVEDVAGTLRWISENGEFVEAQDTTVQPGTVYFIYENGEYVPITNPNTSKNPHEEGWYILDVTDSQASFIMAHLAVTNAGLWILPVDKLVAHELVDSNDNNIIDSDGNILIDWSKDDDHIQKAMGYKVLISAEATDTHPVGVTIYNEEGTAIANYGETTTIGSVLSRHVHIDNTAVYIKRYDLNTQQAVTMAKYGESVELGENQDVQIGTVSNGYVVEKFEGLYGQTNPTVTVAHTLNNIISITAICIDTSTDQIVSGDVTVTSADYTVNDDTITFNNPLTGTTYRLARVTVKYSTTDKITQLSIGVNHGEDDPTNFPLVIGNNNPNISPGDVFQVDWEGKIYTEGHSGPIGTIVKASTNFDTIYTPGIDMYSNYAEMTLNKGTWVVFAQFGVMPSGNVTGCLALRFCKGGRSSEYVVDQARQLGNVNTGYYSAINATTIMNIEYDNTSVYAIASCHYDGTVSARNFKAIRIS